jgi:iron complex outermembrane recepter protein
MGDNAIMGAIVGKRLRNGMSVVVVIVAIAGSEGTGAQGAGKRQVAKAERMAVVRPTVSQLTESAQTYDFNIPAKPLLSALADFTAATGVQVVRLNDEPILGTSRPVVGTFTAAQTLDRMLVGTGLSAPFSEATVVTLEGAMPRPSEGLRMAQTTSAAPRPPAADVLPAEPVTVQEQRPPVTGYVATRSTVGTKLDLPLLDVPQSIQVVPHEVITEQRAITLSDVLRNVSGFSLGVSSQSQRFGDRNVIFRGFTNNNYYTNGFKDAFNGTVQRHQLHV